MRTFILILLLLGACTVSEQGAVQVFTCPSCTAAYDGFATCAFFDADANWSRPGMLVDHRNFHGVGTPIRVAEYMHDKWCFNGTDAVVGTANPTSNGLEKNANIVVRFHSATLARALSAEYAFLQHDGSGSHPKTWMLNNRSMTVLFCPRDACEEHVVAALEKADSSIRFMTFSFTSDAIGLTLRQKEARGVDVRGVIEPQNANGRGSEYKALVASGIPVATPDIPGVMHLKAFVIDDDTAIFGSYNPTANANTRNAETIVITHEPSIIAALDDMYTVLSAVDTK